MQVFFRHSLEESREAFLHIWHRALRVKVDLFQDYFQPTRCESMRCFSSLKLENGILI